MKTCSVIILNWNGRSLLERFLPSVVRYSSGAEIVVADNGSQDDSLEFLAANYPGVRRIALGSNHGFAGGYDLAMEQITSEYSVLLNSDVEVTENWLLPLTEALNGDASLAAVMPKILSFADSGKFEYAGASGGFIDMLGYPFCRGRVLREVEEDSGQYDDRREVFWATGACMAVRTSLFRGFGGFDPDFFAHQEEIDLCWRLRSAGYGIMVEPRSVVLHVGAGTLSSENPRKVFLNHRNNLMMLFKNLSGVSLPWVVAARLLLDGLSAAAYLLKGNPAQLMAVFRAHVSFYRSLGKLSKRRAEVQARRIKSPGMIFRGSVVLAYFTGRRTFSDIVKRPEKL